MTLEQAYDGYYTGIYTYSFSMLGNGDDARDVTQEAFVKLYHHLEEGRPPLDNTKNWLYRVVSNLCLNLLKRRKIFQKVLMLDGNAGRGNPGRRNNPVEEDLITTQERALVQKALTRLPAREQALLMLFRDQFSYADMADILKIKPSSVGKMLSRAREKLAEEIRKGVKP